MTRKSNKAAAAIIIFLIVFIIFLIILMFVLVRKNTSVLLELPSITFTVLDEDSKPHTINAKAAFITGSSNINEKKKEEINRTIEEAIRSTDYSTLTGKDGFEYMKTVVKNKLENEYGSEIGDIYFGQFSCDLVDMNQKEDTYKDEVMHGLFPKTKGAGQK